MKLQRQPNKYSCLITSFAIAVNIDVTDLIKEIGYDGSEILEQWKFNPEPFNRRGFHPQELIYLLYDKGFRFCEYQPLPRLGSGLEVFHPESEKYMKTSDYVINCEKQFNRIVYKHPGIFIGLNQKDQPHAIAWTGTECLDPAGIIKDIQDFKIQSFFALQPSLCDTK